MELTQLMELTQGHLLGGRVRYAQPVEGYRTGIEPVLLAASVPARPGERVLEVGTGAGAGLLCLAARVRGLRGVGVEIDPAMAELARLNLRENAIEGVEIVTADIESVGLGVFDHAFANPPWHDPESTGSPVARRRRAKQECCGGLERWVAAIGRLLAPGGSLTLILPAGQVDRARRAAAGFAGLQARALLPKRGRAPKLAIVQGWWGVAQAGGGLPDAVLHEADGAFTPEIEAVLRRARRRATACGAMGSRIKSAGDEGGGGAPVLGGGEERFALGVLDHDVGRVDHVVHGAGTLVEHVGVEMLRVQLGDAALPGRLLGLDLGELRLERGQLGLADRVGLQAVVAVGGAPEAVGDQAEENARGGDRAQRAPEHVPYHRRRVPLNRGSSYRKIESYAAVIASGWYGRHSVRRGRARPRCG
jgi:tRNA1(Val) A37 N6-methylase TrmN6